MRNLILLSVFILVLAPLAAQTRGGVESWGDQGNGTYVNPVLNSDYSDPDVIRVGDKYYMVCSDFHFIGMPVLMSDDMVNWTIIGQIYDRFDFPGWDTNEHYADGSWAPAIRYHDGRFWVYFCTPDEGLMMSTATDPRGPWSPLHLVKAVEKWEDPCPFWDEDGKAYLVRSQWGAGPIIVHQMSADGKQLLDEGKTVYTGPVAEGPKLYKRDGYYYISIPEGGVGEGWQTVLRSKNIYGPYEKRVVMEQGMTDINGPHQGALVDTPEGEWWFYHFQQTYPLGRVVHLQPVHWADGWPVIGVDIDMNGIGEPVRVWTKPSTAKSSEVHKPQVADEFDSPELGFQWQFNHNPADGYWSLDKRKGSLALTALKTSDMRLARNMLTQKTIGYRQRLTTCLDFGSMADGQRAGLSCFGSVFGGVGVMNEGGVNYLYFEMNGKVENVARLKGRTVYLRVTIDSILNTHQLSYSTDNKNFTDCGAAYQIWFGNWKGSRVGLYTYNTVAEGGTAYFDYLRE